VLTCTGSCNSQPWDVDITIVPVPSGPSVGGFTDLEIHGSGALPAFADAQGSASSGRHDLGFAATVLALAIVGTATVVLARRRWVR
jgi:hypothetical protein